MRSIFYYGFTVDELSNTIRIDEGSGDIDIVIPSGRYAMSNYVNVVANAINSNDSIVNEYEVAVNRITRLITISANGVFGLKVADIFPLNSGYPVMGFKALTNLSGQTSYVSDSPAGLAFIPQQPLHDFVDAAYNKEYSFGTVKESASAQQEVVNFGLKSSHEFNIRWITNTEMAYNAYIENNPNALQDAISFMDYAITKGEIEFMKDRDDRNTFDIINLTKTPDSSQGIGYTLKENFRAMGFFETGNLTFRVIE